ncbi:ribonuclease III [Colletotrichum kahawae]|uniref:Ribonuclease III n=1 Tax=Colletotrichum kahawae TaxID=34407 RepID=A0AAD9XZA2_COLKA|nr:ribonuclease III [Colletotrichum kahawae]
MNDNNRKQKEDGAMAIIGYEFRDRDLLWEALQGKGSLVTQIGGRLLRDNNKKMALVGDGFITLVIRKDAYKDDLVTKGEMNRRVVTLANNARLESLCDNSGLTRCINVSPVNGGVVSRDNKSATVEATVAAVFFDAGIDAAERVMENLGIVGPAASHL